jgi:hypothetical protein
LVLDVNARQANIPQVTGTLCVAKAAEVRASIHNHGVEIAGSDLDRTLRRLERLGDAHPGVLTEAPLTHDQRVAAAYIEQVDRLSFVLRTLESPFVTGDVAARLQWLGKGIDTLTTLTSRAQDYLFELEMAAALVDGGRHVRFAEPDLIVSDLPDLPEIAIPCKRPRTTKGVDNLVRKALSQAKLVGLPSVIAMNLDAILNVRDGKPVKWIGRDQEQMKVQFWEGFKGLVATCNASVRNRTDPLLIGIAWIGRAVGYVRDGKGGPSISSNAMGIAAINRDRWAEHQEALKRLMATLNKARR